MRIIFILTLLSLSCCREPNTLGNAIYLNMEIEDQVDLSKYILNNLTVELEQKEGYLFNQDIDVKYFGNDLVFKDKYGTTIYRYNIKGDAISKFDKKGHADDEYISIVDFTTSKNKLYLLCYPKKIFVLGEDFNIEQIYRLETNYESIAYFDGDIYLYKHHNRDISLMNIADGKITPIFADKRKDINIIPNVKTTFFRCGNNDMYINMFGSDVIYSIIDRKGDIYTTLDYDQKEENYQIIDNLLPEDNMTLLKYSPPTVYGIIETENYIYITYSYKIVFRMVVVDKKENKIVENGYVNSFYSGYDGSFITTDDSNEDYVKLQIINLK